MEHNNKVTKTAYMVNKVLQLYSRISKWKNNPITIPSGIQNGNDAFENQIPERKFLTAELLEEILTLAIYTNDSGPDLQVVKNVRLVQKSWLFATSEILKKAGKPVIKLKLTKNSLQNKNIRIEQGKPLVRFIQTFTTRNGIAPSAIPFKLELTVRFFWEENYDSLLECFTRLGLSLFEIEICYPKHGGTMPVHFPNLNLPSLKKLSFTFSGKKHKKDEHDDTEKFGNNIRGSFLLQSILNGAKNLKELVHPSADFNDVPKDLKFLWLPPKIVNLYFGGGKLESKEFTLLLRNNLPELERLILFVHKYSLEDELLYTILERLKDTLKYFCIFGLTSNGNPRPSTNLRFPIMKRLKVILFNSEECELGPGEVTNLHESLPNLESVTLKCQKVNNFKKWIQNSKFENVENLEVSLVDEYVEDGHEDKNISADTELIRGMYNAFPNILQLTLTFNISDLSGLSCIFQNMTKLKCLDIKLNGNFDGFSSNHFDSKILCLPIPLLTSLEEYGDQFQRVELKSTMSIRNLAELAKLILRTTTNLEDEEDSLLSEILVNYGLLQMPKLKFLRLSGKFKPTPEISKLWENNGRFIVY